MARAEVLNLAGIALVGATNFGAAIGLEHNDAANLATDYHDLVGNPATPLIPGKQTKLDAQIVAAVAATTARHVAIDEGREFCRLVIGILKPVLGSRWNTAWNAAGFTQPSLALPRNPAAMLAQFRGYFAANPARENAALNVTAARAQTLADAISTAIAAQGNAKTLRGQLRLERDGSFKQLRKRLSGLRAELAQLLSPTDQRWYQFGFQRPADGRVPEPVTELTLSTYGPGAISATWALSSLADNYRVSWRLASSSEAPTEVGLFTDRQCLISGLPSGQQVIVLVRARNNSGETEPTEAAIMVS
jgi:hypothetical protein